MEDLYSIPSTDKYIVNWMTIWNGGLLSLNLNCNGGLKNLGVLIKSHSHVFQLLDCQVTYHHFDLCSWHRSNSSLSPAAKNIALCKIGCHTWKEFFLFTLKVFNCVNTKTWRRHWVEVEVYNICNNEYNTLIQCEIICRSAHGAFTGWSAKLGCGQWCEHGQ